MKTILTSALILMIGLTANAQLELKQSPHSADESMTMLKEIVIKKGLTIFAEIDHAENAEAVGMELKSVGVLSFGSPEVGTKLMQADPHVGLELPLRIVIFEKDGHTMIGYTNPENYLETYNLKGQEEILKKMHLLLEEIVETIVKD